MSRSANRGTFQKGHKKVGGFVKGSKHTEEAKRKIAVSLFGKRGELARNWQGGKTAEGVIIRYSTEMKIWRTQVFERDGYKCVKCGSKGYLEADHIKPFAYFPELRFDINNGRTLCRKCHRKTDTYAFKAIKTYA